MSRFVALYRLPKDVDQFERDYRQTHVPLVARTPGLTRIEVSRVTRVVVGEPAPFLMAVMHFADGAALEAGMGSPEWAESGRNLAKIGGLELATMFVLDPPDTYPPQGS